MGLLGSREVARSAMQMSLTRNRNEENALKGEYLKMGIKTVAIDYGGDFITSVTKIIERAVVAAKREGVIEDSMPKRAVAGATREAVSQITPKAFGLSVGGKIAIARYNDHVSVALFLA